MTTTKKKKLELLPEVLPEPKRASSGDGARARTLAHMQRLLAAAAAGGSLAGCTREGSLQDDHRPAGGGSTIPSAPTGAHLALPDAGDWTTPPPIPTPPTATTGYAVVDALPPPAACPGLASEIVATAMWTAKSSSPAVLVVLSASTGKDRIAYGSASDVSIYGGTLVSTPAPGSSQSFLVAPNAGMSSVSVSVSIRCNARPATLSLGLDVSGGRTPGTAVPMTVSSY